MNKAFLPLGIFFLLLLLLGIGLSLDPKKVPSPLIDKPAPAFELTQLHTGTSLSNEQLKGKPWLLNVWASWCVSCRAEHEVIKSISDMQLVNIIGLNYKDDPNDAKRWLQQYGDPYATSVIDIDGKVGIDYGVYGVPETFLIDQQGIIRYKHIGPVTQESLQSELLPEIQKLL